MQHPAPECGLSDGKVFQSGAQDLRAETAARGQWVGAKWGSGGRFWREVRPGRRCGRFHKACYSLEEKTAFLDVGFGPIMEALRTDSFLVD